MPRLKWNPIIKRAAEIVESYGGGVTLRQLFYRLVAEGLIPNARSPYQRLSSMSAEGRRDGTFPNLVDHTRQIHESSSWTSPKSALESLIEQYRRPRTEGQENAIYLGAEKATMLSLLDRWFGELGIPIILLRGYGSQTYLDNIRNHVWRDERDAVMIYAGDLDASGEDIERDFEERTTLDWDLSRIAVVYDQIDDLDLVMQPGKKTDPRAPVFVEKYGPYPGGDPDLPFQIEVEAIEPDTLRDLYQSALNRYWDKSKYEAVLEAEIEDRELLDGLAEGLNGGS